MAEGHPFFALAYSWVARLGDRAGLAERRRNLLSDVRGTVVEIGAGTGLNFRHYPPGVEIVATEPDPHMYKRAERAARAATAKVSVTRASAESLPFPDGSVDVVVSTLVLCSVPDQAASLAEVTRILRPGGRLLLLEHVRSQDPALAAKQDRRESLHVRFAGGCHPNRDTLQSVVNAGFETEAVGRTDLVGTGITRTGIEGVARRPEMPVGDRAGSA